jgi:hypothetical protein
MCKKLVSICLVLFLVPLSYVQADVLVGSWETYTNEGWQDHPLSEPGRWIDPHVVYVDDPQVMPSRYEFSDDWSTEGNVSLKAKVPGLDWYQRKNVVADYFDHSVLEFDVLAVDNYGSGATYAQVEIFCSSQTNGWWVMEGAQFNLSLNTPTHCVVDYMGYGTPEYASPDDAYVGFIFEFDADAQVDIYTDNVQLTGFPIPEPATISLLGLGGLLVLRRKW